MLSPILCAILYAIKGGQHGRIKYIAKLRENKIFDRLLDGKVLSTIGFFLLFGIYHSVLVGPAVYEFPFFAALIASVGWLAGISPKMGRILGQIGGYRGNWDANEQLYPANERKAQAIEGWKSGVQRGVFMGAMLALTTDNLWFIVAGLLFPVTAFVGVSIQQYINKSYAADWHIHEYLFGFVIGLAFLFGL
jgi:hypothetical protein